MDSRRHDAGIIDVITRKNKNHRLPNIPGLQVHLSTCYRYATPAQRFIETAGALQQLNGLSGTTINPSQPTASKRPILEIPKEYHLLGAKYDGVDDYLSSLSSVINTNNTMTLFVVFRKTAIVTNFTQMVSLFQTGQSDNNAASGFAWYPSNATPPGTHVSTSRNGFLDFAPSPPLNETFYYSCNFNGTNCYNYLNGKFYGYTNPRLSSGTFNINNLVLGGDYTQTSTYIPEGYFFELIISNQSLLTSQMDAVHNYLDYNFRLSRPIHIRYGGNNDQDVVSYQGQPLFWEELK